MRYYKLTRCTIPDYLRVNESLLGVLILHRIVLHAVERYSRNLAEDIRDFQNIIGEIDGRNRSDFEQVHGSLSSIHNGQKDILRSHEGSRTRKESQARGNNLSDTTF